MKAGLGTAAVMCAAAFSTGAWAQDTATTYDQGGLGFKNGDAFSFKMSTNMQVRAQITDNRDGASGSDAGDSMSFYIRRLKTSMEGNVFGKAWTYKTTYAWHGNDLEVAELGYQAGDWKLGFGRTKVHFNLQESTSSSRQQFVDRSEANENFNVDHGTGFWASGKQKLDAHELKYTVGVFNGISRAPAAARFAEQVDRANGSGGAAINSAFNMMYTARFDLFVNCTESASIAKYEYDLRRGSVDADKRGDLHAIVGLGFAWQDLDAAETQDLDSTAGTAPYPANVYSLVFDTRIHMGGLSINAAVFHNAVSYGGDVDTDAAHPDGWVDMGFYAQAGYSFDVEHGQFEPALRYGQIDRDDFNSGGTQQDRNELGLAFNYRLKKEKLVLTLDGTYIEDRQHGANANPNRPRAVYRFQVQLGF